MNEDGTLTVRGISAKQAKFVQAVCPEKKLAGLLKVTSEDKTATLKLQPWLSMKGRVVDEDGKPVEGAELSFQRVFAQPDSGALTGFWYKGKPVRTGAKTAHTSSKDWCPMHRISCSPTSRGTCRPR